MEILKFQPHHSPALPPRRDRYESATGERWGALGKVVSTDYESAGPGFESQRGLQIRAFTTPQAIPRAILRPQAAREGHPFLRHDLPGTTASAHHHRIRRRKGSAVVELVHELYELESMLRPV